jgi:opacity protein-like surface antigen
MFMLRRLALVSASFACFVMAPLGAHFSAYAADPRQNVVPYIPPVALERAPGFDWGRCYAGVQIGTKEIRNDMTLQNTDFVVVDFVERQKTNIQGPHVGGQVGCNKWMSGGLLVGLELEGVFGPKAARNCAARIDPLAYCIEYEKDREFFIAGRVGKTFEAVSHCACGPALLLYAKFGAGYTRTQVSANFNQVSYRTQQTSAPGPTDTYQPVWGNIFDMTGRLAYVAPLLGFGFEYALTRDWTVRGEFAGMYAPTSGVDLTAKARNVVGDIPDNDSTGVKRHVRTGDVMAAKMREIETKVSVGVNRYF